MDDDDIIQDVMGTDDECVSEGDDPKLNSKEKKKKIKAVQKAASIKPLQLKQVNSKGLKRGKTVLNPSIKVTIQNKKPMKPASTKGGTIMTPSQNKAKADKLANLNSQLTSK